MHQWLKKEVNSKGKTLEGDDAFNEAEIGYCSPAQGSHAILYFLMIFYKMFCFSWFNQLITYHCVSHAKYNQCFMAMKLNQRPDFKSCGAKFDFHGKISY